MVNGGDLYHKLKQQKGELLQERQVIEWFVQIAMALQYLHEKHILHRDLKTQNIFLTKTNIIKVGDLGIARVLENQNDMASTLIGTPYYMSPELFSNKPYNYKSDVWALGCCVYEMATLKHAFNAKDMNSLVYRIVEGKLPQMPSKYNPQLGELIKSMLSKKPEERPDVKQILRQPYIKRQIALFLEATKEKTAKSRKKVPSSQASNAPPSSTPPFDSKPDQPSPAAADLHKRVKGKEENHVPQEKISGKADEPPPSPKRPSPEAAAGSSLNATGVSVATASSIDIDMLPAENRTKHVVMPPPLLQEMPHSHVETRPGKESKHVKEHPSLPEPCQRKPVPATCGHAGDPRRLLDDGAGGPDPQYRQANSREGQREPDGIQDKENTLRLLQEASGLEYSPQIKEPPVKQSPPAATEKDLPQLQPSCSTSGPSVSRARRQRNRERMQENQNRLLEKRIVRYLPESEEDLNSLRKSIAAQMDDMSRQQSSEDDCSSSTSSTDRSEGDGKEGLNRKYRDTLVLHGKTQQDQVDFRFSKVPSDTTSGPAKIMRVIEHLRTDVVKGLGIKLLDRVLEIMEEDDEEQREAILLAEKG
ncbi:serine/threonine-protein kinase Nek4-like [Scleropages formosus]|uniref:non-specific serine/threonine protein kinase n=1 Tax=Scleropages formosus TaxID=113540 RepID=A0A0P7VLA7_SCLFO|nr:serine/threonine-protein kinase Nek4-like [Scleropages formosus]